MDNKIIEEMVGDIAKVLSGVLVSEIVNLAYFLDEQGYRKIPENAVVLTKEAYNRLFTKARQSEIKTIDLESIVNARKETAEKFAKRVKMAFYYEFDEIIPSIMADKIDEICKEITEGEKEISNETV